MHFNGGKLYRLTYETQREMIGQWQSLDGRSISGFLYQPPKRFIGRRPVIVNIHSGPTGQSRPTFLGRSNYFVNEFGCATLFPNV